MARQVLATWQGGLTTALDLQELPVSYLRGQGAQNVFTLKTTVDFLPRPVFLSSRHKGHIIYIYI
jgi:hypothetical protein